MLTGVTIAVGIEGAHVGAILAVADFDDALRDKKMAVTGVAGGHDAIKHIDAAFDARDQIGWRAHAHQIARVVD